MSVVVENEYNDVIGGMNRGRKMGDEGGGRGVVSKGSLVVSLGTFVGRPSSVRRRVTEGTVSPIYSLGTLPEFSGARNRGGWGVRPVERQG